jgi:hypothetical protein
VKGSSVSGNTAQRSNGAAGTSLHVGGGNGANAAGGGIFSGGGQVTLENGVTLVHNRALGGKGGDGVFSGGGSGGNGRGGLGGAVYIGGGSLTLC